MNDFINLTELGYPEIKKYDIQGDGTDGPIKAVINKIEKDFPSCTSSKFNVVYCYSLSTGTFDYPNGKSNVLYIGHTEGELKKSKISLSFRFVHCKEGHDCKSNICLRHYYKAQIPLTLEIYVLPNTRPAQKVEAKLRWQFLEKYAALPIADGASYKKQSKEM